MKFTIIATSDIHGHAERFSQLTQMIKKRKPALLIDNGDFLQGSHLSYFYERIHKQQHPMISMANNLHYDVAVFGNHEFNYALPEIEKMRTACNFPWIAGNIGEFAQPYFIKIINGLRVAVIGIVTHHVPLWDESNLTKQLYFTDALQAAKYWVHHVRSQDQADLVILSYHGGFERDIQTDRPFDKNTGENQGYAMLKEIKGIDIFITGHQHLELATKVNGVSIVQPGANAHCFAQIDVTVEQGRLTHVPSLVYVDETIPSDSFPLFENWATTTIGETAHHFTYDDFLQARLTNHSYIQLIHNVQLKATSAQLSITELPYHSHGGFSGAIKIQHVLHNYPRTNHLKVIQLTGAEIRAALEQCAAVFAINNQGDIDFSTVVFFPEPHPYVYDIWGGLDYELMISRPIGERVTKLVYNDLPITADMTFDVVINSYRATGVHDFGMLKKSAIREISTDIPALIMNYIRENSPLTVTLENNWRVLK